MNVKRAPRRPPKTPIITVGMNAKMFKARP
jgi:hypothetical protein